MIREIFKRIEFPFWMTFRQRRLSFLDLALDGELYEHLPYPFTQELNGGQPIKMLERRPSFQYGIPNLVARQTAYKLWAGRNRPRLICPDEGLVKAAEALVEEGCLIEKITEATIRGSVGSSFITFGISLSYGLPNLQFDVWRSRDCAPLFDDAGELLSCRVQYVTPGSAFLAQGIVATPVERIKPDDMYWFTRDYTRDWVVTYFPLEENSYSPNDPDDQVLLVPDGDRSALHALGCVPGSWLRNLPGGNHPEGASTFGTALGNCVVLDYTLSQIPRSLWYNLCPRVVMWGDFIDADEAGPGAPAGAAAATIHFEGSQKQADQTVEHGDAKLLETNGAALDKAQAFTEHMRKLILEQIMASRKDPDKFSSPQSGKAAVVLDEEHTSLVQVLRSAYGEKGFMPLLRKAMQAAYLAGHPAMEGVNLDFSEFGLQWPELHTYSAQELSQLIPSLLAVVEQKGLELDEVGQIVRVNLDLSPPIPKAA